MGVDSFHLETMLEQGSNESRYFRKHLENLATKAKRHIEFAYPVPKRLGGQTVHANLSHLTAWGNKIQDGVREEKRG